MYESLRADTSPALAPEDSIEPITEATTETRRTLGHLSIAPSEALVSRNGNVDDATEAGKLDQVVAKRENPEYSERDRAFLSIIRKYRDHPAVQASLNSYRSPDSYKSMDGEFIDDPLSHYIVNLGEYRQLDTSEQPRLFRRLEKGLEVAKRLENIDDLSPEEEAILLDTASAYQILYNCNLRLPFSIAKRYRPKFEKMFIDLVQEGNMALGKAIRRFDYTKGYTLSTYASWWIRQQIQRAIADQSRTIRLPVHEHSKLVQIEKKTKELTQKLGYQPSIDELASYVDMSVNDLQFLFKAG